MEPTREQKGGIGLILLIIAIAVGISVTRSGNGGDNEVTSVAKGPDEGKVLFCSRTTGLIATPGTYTDYDRCLDYLKLVAQGLVDPDKVPPPGTPSETSAPQTTVAPDTPAGPIRVTGETPCPPATVDPAAPKAISFERVPPTCIDATKAYTAVFDTSEGEIRVALDVAKTPKTANNFIVLARYKYYDDTRIFRTDRGLDIIQGGGMSNTTGPGYSIPDEGSGYTYEPGNLAMARTSAPNSAGAQWFFATGPRAAAALNPQGTYVTFGRITQGLDVAQKIIGLDAGGFPGREVVVRTIRIIES